MVRQANPKIYENDRLWASNFEHVFKNKFSNKIFAITVGNLFTSFHEYYIYNKKCAFFIQRLDIKIPTALNGMQQCGYAHSLDNNYLFICGGFTEEVGDKHFSFLNSPEDGDEDDDVCVSDDEEAKWITMKHCEIHIVDLKKMQIFECRIQMPQIISGPCHAICMEDKTNDQLIVNGFIKDTYKAPSFSAIPFPPVCIINIMLNHYYNEYLHIMQINTQSQKKGKHYKINSMHLINEMKRYSIFV